MSVLIGDEATDRAIRDLAEMKGVSVNEAVPQAVEQELASERARRDLIARISVWQDRVATLGQAGGEPADKAFFDALSGQD